jgi:hypothetical protein
MAENFFDESDTSGSSIGTGVPNANNLAIGQTPPATATVNAEQHKELESLVGRQGQELGELRKFFSDISPILDTLDKSPEIVQAIIDGKITPELAKAAMEGQITIGDAQVVAKAQDEVKKDLGKAEFKATSADEISRLVEAKAREIKGEFDAKLKERDDERAFESSVNEFINKTADFSQYAQEIDKWLDDHDVTDIAVAYYAVKGEMSEKAARKQAEIDRVEAEKSGALNMGGGATSATYRIRGDANVLDSLIASKSNPNVFS